MKGDVTVVITACNRADLLIATLDSFLKHNTYPIHQYIISEDSGIEGVNDAVKKRFSHLNIRWIEPDKRRGQIASIDEAYSFVETPYIFHCEEDWRFINSGFIELSKAVLQFDTKIITVWLRGLNYEPNCHQPSHKFGTANGVKFRYMATHFRGVWHGFTFNPGLRRLSDYKKIAPYGKYTNFDRTKPHESEMMLSKVHYQRGFRAATLLEPFVTHIGANRHVS